VVIFFVRLLRHIVSGSLAVAVAAAAGPVRAASETVVYAFKGNPDGAYPAGDLVEVGNKLYGTAAGGVSGAGVVFSVTPAGAETVEYSFNPDNDGSGPAAGLIKRGRNLYGTTGTGGTDQDGTVFRITRAGAESVVFALLPSEGAYPRGGVIDVAGTLYGTAEQGGAFNNGTVFKVQPQTGAAAAVYAFSGGVDGGSPAAGLRHLHGLLYGTTAAGGAYNLGTVFVVNPRTGEEKVVHSFQNNGTDGYGPMGRLIDVGGTLYGTTYFGGAGGRGTVFSVTPAGVETVLYAFAGGADGAAPDGSLTDVSGTLYGTTVNGGGSSNCAAGCGTVFSVTPGGGEAVVYAFQGGNDGANPDAGLIDVAGVLYGTTRGGGYVNCYGAGCGTVFAITP